MGFKLPTYRRHPNGQAFYEFKGKRTYLGKYDSPESHERFAKVIAQIAAGGRGALGLLRKGDDLSIDELILAYFDFAETYYQRDGKPTKELAGVTAALKLLSRFAGEDIGCWFGPRRLIEFQQYMVGTTYTEWRGKPVEKKYTRTMVNKQISRIKRFFRWACKNELLPPEQYHKLLCVESLEFGRCTAPEPDDIVPVPREVVNATLPYLQPTVAAMVRVQMLCGMRPGEVCIMRACDLAISGPIWIYTVPEHKNAWRGHTLVKAIPAAAQAILRPLLTTNLTKYLFSPQNATAERRGRFVQRTRRKVRERYDTGTYRRAIVYGLEKAERAGIAIPHWHPNQLRHTIATEIRQTIGQQAAQLWLGHLHTTTTDIYAEKQVSELIAIAQELDRRWATG